MIHLANQVTVAAAGTAVACASTRTMATWVIISNLVGNTGTIYVGDSTVGNGATSQGVPVVKGGSVTFPFSGAVTPYDLQTIYINADNNGDKASVVYFRS